MTIVPTSMSCRSRRRSLKRAKLQNSSASRVTAAHVGFFILNQSGKRPNGKRNPSLRDDAFKTHFASVREDGRAVAFSTSSLGDIFPSFSNIGASNVDTARPTCPHGSLDQPSGRCHPINYGEASILLDRIHCNNVPKLGEHWHLGVRIRTSTRQRLCIFCCLGRRGTNLAIAIMFIVAGQHR